MKYNITMNPLAAATLAFCFFTGFSLSGAAEEAGRLCLSVAGASNGVVRAAMLTEKKEYLLQRTERLCAPDWQNAASPITNAVDCEWRVPSEVPAAFYRLIENVVPEKTEPWSRVNEINDDWLYLERDTEDRPADADDAYQSISLPHTWNAVDTLQSNDYRRASSWYRKNLELSSDQLQERLYLKFLGAAQRSRVFLNGTLLVSHNGGYSSFVCELTGRVIDGTNRIDVWVNNETVDVVAPQGDPSNKKPDFNSYGGLYRSVQLISAPELSISRNYYGGPGFRLWSEQVCETNADLQVTVWVDNGSNSDTDVTVLAQVMDLDGGIVSSGSNAVSLSGSTNLAVAISMPPINHPRLWSPENPELYTVEISLLKDGQIVDVADAPYGFRWFEFTAEQGFFLNGKPYKLHGANRHQDYLGQGNALTMQQHYNDLMLMKEAGCNWVRLAHYQQDNYVLQLCDQLGLLVWEEIPYVGGGNANTLDDTLRSMIRELVEQHFNYSSVIVWGMGNEIYNNSKLYNYLVRMKAYIHELDPLRQGGYVSGDTDLASTSGVAGAVDVMGYNLYRGWYGNSYTSLTERITELHNLNPDIPLILTEFGAGSDLSIHSDSPRSRDFSIEYQNDFMESHLQQLEAGELDWLCGATWWAFCDFGSVWREDTMPHINQKGTVTFERTKKDAFYLMKSYWSNEPVVHIEASTWTERNGDALKTYRVFSNMESVEFFQNGISLGSQTNGFVWPVTLVNGINALRAVGTSSGIHRQHEFNVQFGTAMGSRQITATAEEAENPVTNLIDEDLTTRWAAENDQTINYDLGSLQSLTGLQILFYNGDTRTYSLTIQGSSDGSVWTSLFDGNSALSGELQPISFETSQNIRYLQIEALGNNVNNWNSYYEIVPVVN